MFDLQETARENQINSLNFLFLFCVSCTRTLKVVYSERGPKHLFGLVLVEFYVLVKTLA